LEYSELLEESRKFVIARQLLKSGTSIGANVREAQSAESLSDFIHKLKIAAKEADETEYWLELCQRARSYPNPEGLIEMNKEIIKLLTSIITKSKAKLQASKSQLLFVTNWHIGKLTN
jgi:four helix bundle protein